MLMIFMRPKHRDEEMVLNGLYIVRGTLSKCSIRWNWELVMRLPLKAGLLLRPLRNHLQIFPKRLLERKL